MVSTEHNQGVVLLLTVSEKLHHSADMGVDLARQAKIERPQGLDVFIGGFEIRKAKNRRSWCVGLGCRAKERMNGTFICNPVVAQGQRKFGRVIHGIIGRWCDQWRVWTDIGEMCKPALVAIGWQGCQKSIGQKGGVAVLGRVEGGII